MHFQAQNLARFTFNQDLEGPTANFAIGGEMLRRGARVNHQVKALTAIRALNGFAGFHVQLPESFDSQPLCGLVSRGERRSQIILPVSHAGR
jgi:hypothetical protein